MLEEYVGYSNDLPNIENERERKMTKAIENTFLDDFCLQSEKSPFYDSPFHRYTILPTTFTFNLVAFSG